MISKIITEDKIQQVKKWLNAYNDIVIISHASPDGDAVGSSLAFYHFLFMQNKKVNIILPDSFPDFLSWMPGNRDIIIYDQDKEKADEILRNTSMIFALDFNVLSRLGNMAAAVENSEAIKILVDHHPNPGQFCDLIISHPEISSTCEVIFRLICRMGHFNEINLPCAEAVYTGMMTDTGAFTYNSNNTEVYVIISELIRKGINKDEIYNKVYNNYSADRYRLLGYALSEKMKIYPEYRTAVIYLTKEEQQKYNYKKGDTEGFVNMPLSIKGIIFSAIFREEDDQIRISLRSQGNFPVNTISQLYFNGGGHINAAGGESKLSMDELLELFESILPKHREMLEMASWNR